MRDQTQVPCAGSTESYPLITREVPGAFIIRNFQTCSEALRQVPQGSLPLSCCIGGRVSDAVVLGG